MSQLTLPALYKALTLRERATLPGVNGSDCHFDAVLAEKHYTRWKAQRPFANPVLFAGRLAQDNLNEATFFRLLGQSCQAYQAAVAPDWADQLLETFVENQPAVFPASLASNDGEDGEQPATGGFLTVIAPLIRVGRERVQGSLAALRAASPHTPLADPHRVEAMLFANVRGLLERTLAKTLALELNISRLQGTLSGATPEERFADFVEKLRQPARACALVEEYPVLFRQATAMIDAWANVSLELMMRLCTDWTAIRETFNAGLELGTLTCIKRVARHTRRSGRAVVILTFGSGFKIVYKPRSLAVEHHFQELLDWLNQGGHQPPFRLLKLLDRGAYGWVEWLAAAKCASAAEVQQFYRRQGAYLALLYALEATDFHLGNIIAVGEHPMLIDLEMLFHPRDAERDLPPLEQALDHAIYHSVLRPGLLPEPELSDDESSGFDLSGLAGAAGQWAPYPAPSWESRGTDAMRLVYRPVTIAGGQNLPTLGGRPVNVVDYGQAIEEGFATLYRLMIQRREELLAPDGPLARFAQDEIRVMPRSGSYYSSLLDQSFHPDLMRDALDRERFLDRLWQAVEREPTLEQLIPYEKSDLLAGDIPLFTTLADSRDAYSSKGQCLRDFFPQSGLEAARQRIATLDEDNLARQSWFIQAALATVANELKKGTPRGVSASAAGAPPIRHQLLDLARAIGERLDQLALRAAGEVSWLGVALLEDRHWEIRPLELDLYNGLSGLALFLAHLGAITGQTRWTNLAQAAVATLRRYIAEEMAEGQDALTAVGVFDGLGGLLYTLAHLAAQWQQPDLLQTAVELVLLAQERIGEEKEQGLAHGVAGCLVGLLALHHVAPTLKTQTVAQQYGDYLLQGAQLAPSGLKSRWAVTQPFAPFWHGRLGVAWALLALARLSHETRFRRAALAMLDETLVVEQTAEEMGDAAVKRHAPGTALGCLRVLPYINDAARQARLWNHLEAALQTTLAHGWGRNHALGHGDLGYLDLLWQASVVLNDGQWRNCCVRHTAAVVADLQHNRWVTGIPLGVESPGLMAGLAGIGYGLLRLAEPQRVPSVLALERPHR